MTIATKTIGILLAAGESRRMNGREKQMEHVGDIPAIRHAAIQMIQSRIGRVVVVAAADKPHHFDALSDLEVEVLKVDTQNEGMGGSLRAAVVAYPNADRYVIALADMPDVSTDLIVRLNAAADRAQRPCIVRPRSNDGRFGHPVIFDGSFAADLMTCAGDTGAANVIKHNSDNLVYVDVGGSLPVDLDTQYAWQQWRDFQSKTD